ncbi:MAG: aquaporin, partial [Thermoleophilaceae bacterium]|nr:aquaporin [Thermoleophilaceae bacterium]
MQDRGSAAYIAEFLGTFLLVLLICLAASLFVQVPTQAQPAPFIDWNLIGLVHAFALFLLIQTLALVSGAHFNPAVTVAMTSLRQIKPADAVI